MNINEKSFIINIISGKNILYKNMKASLPFIKFPTFYVYLNLISFKQKYLKNLKNIEKLIKLNTIIILRLI